MNESIFERKRKSEMLQAAEKDYENLKKKFKSEGCYFEMYGYRPTMEFVWGYTKMKDSLKLLKEELQKLPTGTTLKYLADNDILDGDPIGFLDDYIGTSDEDRILSRKYEDRYDYDFICRFEAAFNEYVSRMFSKEDENCFLAVKPIEEIIVRTIFTGEAAEFEMYVNESGYEWKDDDYAIAYYEEDDEPGPDNPFHYDCEWIYEDYMTDADIENVLYSSLEITEEIQRSFGIYMYPFEDWFNKVFWGTDKEPLTKQTKTTG